MGEQSFTMQRLEAGERERGMCPETQQPSLNTALTGKVEAGMFTCCTQVGEGWESGPDVEQTSYTGGSAHKIRAQLSQSMSSTKFDQSCRDLSWNISSSKDACAASTIPH